MTYNKPLPQITPLDRPFWEHAQRSQLVVQHCDACGDLHVPASPVCPNCLGSEQDWKLMSGRGTLESWVDFHRAYWDGFKDDLPYRVCLVRLDEGPLMVSNLVGGDGACAIGARVHVVFDRVTDEVTLPKFALGE
jgi:uncharacterized OB-fold protein